MDRSKSNRGADYYYPFKYKQKRPSKTEEYSIIRLAEVYLIRAEANAKSNHLLEALSDLNTIRIRAGLPEITTQSQEEVLLAIEKERQVELFCEWGNRWFDLIRTGRAAIVLSAGKPNWNSSAVRYPIPQSEIDANRSLTQNDGY